MTNQMVEAGNRLAAAGRPVFGVEAEAAPVRTDYGGRMGNIIVAHEPPHVRGIRFQRCGGGRRVIRHKRRYDY